MKIKILVLSILFLTFCLQCEEAAASAPVGDSVAAAVTVKDGYALLNSLLTLFDNLTTSGTSGSGGITIVENRLEQLSKDVNLAHEANLVDTIFYNRYRRLLMIFKMVITPVVKSDLLEHPFIEALTDFVWDVTYERWAWGDKGSIGKLSAALDEEFVQLQFYLDSRQAREEFKKKLGPSMLPPPPPLKKKSEIK